MGEHFIGVAIPRGDDPRLLAGRGRYMSDLTAEHMLHAVVIRSARAHARIRGIDRSAALAAPGVHAVYIAEDLGQAQRGLPSFGQFPKPLIDKLKPTVRNAPVTTLAAGKVRHIGEPLALLVADDPYLAADAADLVVVDYEELPALTSCEAALAADAPKLFEDWPDNVALAMRIGLGDAEAAFRAAPHRIAERFDSQRYTGVPLEGRGMLAIPDAVGEGLTVWSSHQMPHFQRALICEALGIPDFAVRVAQPDIGGGFGQKAGLYPEDVLVPFAAKRLGRPVKWLEDKREHFMSSSHSRQQHFEAEIAFDDQGKILGLRYRVTLDAGAYLTFPVVLPYLGMCHFFGPFRIPAFEADIRSVVTNKVTSAPYRGAGRPEAVFVLNRLVDRIAAKLGLDRAEVRRRNFIQPQELPLDVGVLYRDGSPMVIDSGNYPAAMQAALDAIGYADFPKRQAEARAAGRYLGIGFANNIESGGIGPVESARVRVDPSGRIVVYVGVTDTGQGQRTVMSQICADILSVPPQQISVVCGDTAGLAFSRGTYHSRAAVAAGNAVNAAAKSVKKKILQIASHHFEAAVDDLELIDGAVSIRGVPDMKLSLARCAQLSIPEAKRPADVAPGLDETSYFDIPKVVWGNACHAALVEVDPGLGAIKILRYVVVHDCGRVLNPLLLEGQIHGGVAAGIGGALLEEIHYDGYGEILTTTLADYMIPRATDIPKIEIVLQETPSPFNPLGVKGAGEGGTISPGACLASAVEDALAPFGVRISRTPLSPSLILAALREAEARSR
jgi:carbon-monoxide dehydrogenase large subunit